MSQKRKQPADLASSLSALKDLFVILKPLLHTSLPLTRPPTELLRTLSAIAKEAAQLGALAARKPTVDGGGGVGGRLGMEDQDWLDAEGVFVWNRSGEWKVIEGEGRGVAQKGEVISALRLAAWRTIDSSYSVPVDVKGLIRLLTLGGKAACALSGAGKEAEAEAVLTRCAAYEEQLSHLPPSRHEGESIDRAKAITGYFLARTESSFHRGMMDPAWFMMKKACDDLRLTQIPASDIIYIVLLAQEVANHLLQKSTAVEIAAAAGKEATEVELAGKALQAIEWLSYAMRLGESLREEPKSLEGVGNVDEIKRETLSLIARAYVTSSSLKPENIERAEAALDEILNDAEVQKSSDAESSLWLKLNCLQRRKAPDKALADVFKLIIDISRPTTLKLDAILREILNSKTGCSRQVQGQSLQHLLFRLLHPPAPTPNPQDGLLPETIDSEGVSRVLLSLSFWAKADAGSVEKAVREIERAFDVVEAVREFELHRSATAAYQTVLWKMGDRSASLTPPKFLEAARCYDLASHPALRSMKADFPKIHRKVALCYIKAEDFERAKEKLRACPWDESATHYLRFMLYAQRGMEEEADTTITDMVKCADLDSQMLILATELANAATMKTVILSSLTFMLEKLLAGSLLLKDVSVLVLIRSIVRLNLQRLLSDIDDPSDRTRDSIISTLLKYFDTSLEIGRKLATSEGENAEAVDPTFEKSLSWLYKQAYNTAVTGCEKGWPQVEVFRLFESSIALMKLFEDVSVAVDPELGFSKALAAYAATAGRMFLAKDLQGQAKLEAYSQIATASCPSSLAIVQPLLETETNLSKQEQLKQMCQVLRVYQIETLCDLQDWAGAERVVEETASHPSLTSSSLFESLANIIWTRPACPPNVTFSILEKLLTGSLNFGLLNNLDKFSRWLRTLIIILLARGGEENIAKAQVFASQAVELCQVRSGSEELGYPPEEIDWLLATSWNQGNDELNTANLHSAKAWFETSLALLPFTRANQNKGDLMRRRYAELLGKMSR